MLVVKTHAARIGYTAIHLTRLELVLERQTWTGIIFVTSRLI